MRISATTVLYSPRVFGAAPLMGRGRPPWRSDVISTRRGVQAGLPIADLVFSCAMTKVLGVIRRKLVAADLVAIGNAARVKPMWKSLLDVSAVAACPFHDVSYVDDCAFPIYGGALELCGKISQTLSIVHESLSAYGLEVN